jgi:hypothetical protein
METYPGGASFHGRALRNPLFRLATIVLLRWCESLFIARLGSLMNIQTRLMAAFAVALLCALPAETREKKTHGSKAVKVQSTGEGPAVLWRDPVDIASRDLFYGEGGKADAPHGRFTFVEEDLKGSNPKFDVRDENGVKWKVKLGIEVKSGAAASRLVWGVGYAAPEDYFVPELKVDHLPAHLHRGQEFVSPDGTVRLARLKRYSKDEKKIANWNWDDNPFDGTRELNGLRVLMGLMNSWDLKEENNAVYQEKAADGSPERVYMVNDLGASFGAPRIIWPLKKSRGNLKDYEHSKFITAMPDDSIDLKSPARAWLPFWFDRHEYRMRLALRHIGRDIPLEDARWMGQQLARLSHAQICDAFRAAGYSPEQVEGFAGVVEERIAELNAL